ncbi:cytochrome P450 [Calocera cornea HHB12733]|uniref:Cytochrome P450 n=1 Tax=Calocera cornea HHB12733 TaxID=1353952 RepID=A0A165EA73_9BASI|nr:cytochrome P450 [Calocera cornea HHB12733]
MGQTIVVLSGAKEAADVLDRLSQKTSDRPRLIKVNDFLCRGMEFTFLPRSTRWRTMRRAAHEGLHVGDLFAMLEEEARTLVQGLVEHPEVEHTQHIHRMAASIGWRSIFGHDTVPLTGPDPTHHIDKQAVELTVAMLPGGSIVDIFPPLKPIIARIAYLRRRADRWFEDMSTYFEHYYSANQTADHSSVSRNLKGIGGNLGLDSHTGAWIAGALFFAAEDTAACAMLWFIYAMMLYPETGKAARKQLSEVVGERPPSFADRGQLPQVDAMVKEVLRWRPPAPLGVPHAASEELVYGGFVIPRGAIVVANIYEISRDPLLYGDGDHFDPSRFIDTNQMLKAPERDSKDDYLCFGHGRRICVGKDLAINSLWITIVHLLWAFDFKQREEDSVVPTATNFHDKGATIEPKRFLVSAIARHPNLMENLKTIVLDE